ncbi:hypothetical protein SV7mr_22630 [Stieleria bergensis]|uniref:Uncharacterized protein n=1 Tax=Stieleria bergensis TaxID=2528025 RepID=A0A517SUE8_9BACT|nr:hypothetical protein SV7mr_22630 [Planctomycetes bacterium SV_7m_r]
MEHLRRSAGQPEVPSKHMIRNTPKQPAKPKAAAFTILSRVPNAEGVLPQSPGLRSAPWGQTPMQILSERRRCSTNGPGKPNSTQASPRLRAQTLAPKIVGCRACTTALRIFEFARTTVRHKTKFSTRLGCVLVGQCKQAPYRALHQTPDWSVVGQTISILRVNQTRCHRVNTLPSRRSVGFSNTVANPRTPWTPK